MTHQPTLEGRGDRAPPEMPAQERSPFSFAHDAAPGPQDKVLSQVFNRAGSDTGRARQHSEDTFRYDGTHCGERSARAMAAEHNLPGKASSIPEAISKDCPKLTLEMPGPLGNSLRTEKAYDQAAKDYAAANRTRAKNFADKQRGNFVVSKENAQSQTKGLLGGEFAKAHGRSLSMAFGKAKGKDRGR